MTGVCPQCQYRSSESQDESDLKSPSSAEDATGQDELKVTYDMADIAWLTNPTDFKSPRMGKEYDRLPMSMLLVDIAFVGTEGNS
jgi:hypothetical protein